MSNTLNDAVAAAAAAVSGSSSPPSEASIARSEDGGEKRVSVDSPFEADGQDPPKKRQRTEEERKKDRVLANRRSARESRERRKKLMQDLEESVTSLSNENTVLTRENDNLRKQLESMLVMNTQAPPTGALAGAANPLLAKSLAASLLLQSTSDKKQQPQQPVQAPPMVSAPKSPSALPPIGLPNVHSTDLHAGLNISALSQLGVLQSLQGQVTQVSTSNPAANLLAALAASGGSILQGLQPNQQQG